MLTLKGFANYRTLSGFELFTIYIPRVLAALQPWAGISERLRRFQTYPVVTDQDYSTWKAYGVEAWPTLFALNKQGRVRWTHVGEGYYGETEEVIKKLLAEYEPAQTSLVLQQ